MLFLLVSKLTIYSLIKTIANTKLKTVNKFTNLKLLLTKTPNIKRVIIEIDINHIKIELIQDLDEI